MLGRDQISSASFTARMPPGAMRILLVDDNVDVVESLAVLLEMYGHRVLTCTHPEEALDTAPAFAPEVCILDIGLPVMSGHVLARRLMGAGLHDATYIAVTGYGSPEVRAASKHAGFDLHLTKPVNPEFLIGRIAALAMVRLHTSV